uniref:hypothetical protein n=1 Tax=Flavobacterium sp. TaxID=239 RepID=UPI0040482EF5
MLILLFFIGCSKYNFENALIGRWKSVSSSNFIFYDFDKDSVKISQWGKIKLYNWNINESKIVFKSKFLNEEFDIDYKLNRDNDTLFVKNKNELDYQIFIKSN